MVKCKICRKNGLRSPNEKVVHVCLNNVDEIIKIYQAFIKHQGILPVVGGLCTLDTLIVFHSDVIKALDTIDKSGDELRELFFSHGYNLMNTYEEWDSYKEFYNSHRSECINALNENDPVYIYTRYFNQCKNKYNPTDNDCKLCVEYKEAPLPIRIK
jgi:hypothetical protein